MAGAVSDCSHPSGAATGEGVFCFPYREEHLSLLAPVGHPLAKLPVIRAADLAHQNLLLYSEIGFWTQICREKLPEAHFLFMNEWDAFGELVGLGAFPCFITDAFPSGQPMENKVVIPIESEDFQAVYYFLCLEKEPGEVPGAHYPSSGKAVLDAAPLNRRTETADRSQALEGKPHFMGKCFLHGTARNLVRNTIPPPNF